MTSTSVEKTNDLTDGKLLQPGRYTPARSGQADAEEKVHPNAACRTT